MWIIKIRRLHGAEPRPTGEDAESRFGQKRATGTQSDVEWTIKACSDLASRTDAEKPTTYPRGLEWGENQSGSDLMLALTKPVCGIDGLNAVLLERSIAT